MSKKNNNSGKKNIHLLPNYTGASIGLIALLIAEAIFLLFVLALDVFPFKFIVLMLVIMALIDFGIMVLLGNRRRNTVKRIIGLILVILVMNMLLVGDYYAYSTYDTFQKISARKATWETYRVVVLQESKYQTVDDITGQTVNVMSMQSKQLNEARERLITKADVSYNEEPDCITVGKHLMDDEGNVSDEIILVTDANYKLLKENIKGFGKNTQSIYKIKVKKRANDNAKRLDVTEESFNVLLSGVDNWGKLDDSGLSDVNMVMTVNPKTKEILLTSIPRDSYVILHSYGQYDKLTHSGIYGVNETRATIEDFLGIDINYYARVNFVMLVRLVHAVGGIDVYSDYDFHSILKGYHYEKGWNHLTGKEALYFARERKAFKDGDMQRNKNQQLVLEATIKKVTSSKVLLLRYTKILNAIEDYMQTDLSDKDIKKLVKMQLNDMSKWTINKTSITGSTGGAGTYSMGMDRKLSVVFPNQETVDAAKEAIHDTMYPVDNTKKKNKEKDQKTEDNSQKSESEE